MRSLPSRRIRFAGPLTTTWVTLWLRRWTMTVCTSPEVSSANRTLALTGALVILTSTGSEALPAGNRSDQLVDEWTEQPLAGEQRRRGEHRQDAPGQDPDLAPARVIRHEGHVVVRGEALVGLDDVGPRDLVVPALAPRVEGGPEQPDRQRDDAHVVAEVAQDSPTPSDRRSVGADDPHHQGEVAECLPVAFRPAPDVIEERDEEPGGQDEARADLLRLRRIHAEDEAHDAGGGRHHHRGKEDDHRVEHRCQQPPAKPDHGDGP